MTAAEASYRQAEVASHSEQHTSSVPSTWNGVATPASTHFQESETKKTITGTALLGR